MAGQILRFTQTEDRTVRLNHDRRSKLFNWFVVLAVDMPKSRLGVTDYERCPSTVAPYAPGGCCPPQNKREGYLRDGRARLDSRSRSTRKTRADPSRLAARLASPK